MKFVEMFYLEKSARPEEKTARREISSGCHAEWVHQSRPRVPLVVPHTLRPTPGQFPARGWTTSPTSRRQSPGDKKLG
jgi:hypothetical protein